MNALLHMVGINSHQGPDGKNTEPDVHRIMESVQFKLFFGYMDEECTEVVPVCGCRTGIDIILVAKYQYLHRRFPCSVLLPFSYLL